ncbi:CtsR family transcriptional regulator [Carnobacteriaceae bacterium zg-ZUI78]|nr:CtsR family transcriptional regulator [Carnobacteriaceae bacterium zg-ZUI78]
MQGKRNISDIIENYLKDFLVNDNHVIIQRNELATLFECVPSQINYVIKTRFTQNRGYIVQSKRGGAGYVRISKLDFCHTHIIDALLSTLSNSLSMNEAVKVISQLHHEQVLTKREMLLIQASLERDMLQSHVDNDEQLRADLLKSQLRQLRYQYNESEE